MRYRGRLIILWLLTTLLFDATVMVFRMITGQPPSDRPTLLAITFLALSLSQTGLLAIWIGSGRTTPWRALAGIVWVILVSELIKIFLDPNVPFFDACWFVAAQMITIIGVLGIAWLAGCRLASRVDPRGVNQERETPSQFTLRNLFAWMTALAVILGLLRSLVLLGIRFSAPRSDFLAITLFSGLFVLPPLSVLWVVNGEKYLSLRGIQLFIVLGLFSLVVLSISKFQGHIAGMFALEFLFLVGSLTVFRLEGFRLVRRQRTTWSASIRDQVPPHPD